MNASEYFGRNLDAAPEPEEYPCFEVWCWRLVSEERRAIESLIRESVSARADAGSAVPPTPDNMPVNSSIAEAWRLYHSVPRRTRGSTWEPVRENGRGVRPRRRPMRTLVEDQRFDHLLPG